MKRITTQVFLQKCNLAENIFSAGLLQAKMDIGNFAVDLFQKSFQAEKVQGGESKSWEPRKKPYNWFIMQKTGNLKASIRWTMIQDYGVRVSTDVPYSQFHNDFNLLPITTNPNRFYANWQGGAWQRNQHSDLPISQRQFIGHSSFLDRYVERRLGILMKNIY